jgi:REP element-mobilizing transposase RayT
MIFGYHVIWTVYGSWLPNDPRGSSSHDVRLAKIDGLGELHAGRKKIQPAGREIRAFYSAARPLLKHDYLELSVRETASVGAAFTDVIKRREYTCYACAILPDHVHLLIRKHRDTAETMLVELQSASRDAVLNLGERAASHPVWGGGGWKAFLDSVDDVRRVVRYIERNPGRPQRWNFVTAYDGWAPGMVIRAKPQARSKHESDF